MSEPAVNFWVESTAEELFRSIDTNDDGNLSRAEIRRSLQANHIPISDKILDSIFEYCDLDQNGVISLEEFQAFTRVQNEKLRQIFFSLDRDHSGFLTMDEVKNTILKLDPSYKDYNLRKMIDKLDLNKDGRIDLKEFMQFYHMIPTNNIRMTFDFFAKEGIDIGESVVIPNERDDEPEEGK